MRAVRGIVLASGLFLASFALHIVGGATDQAWLFAIAVVLIYVTATAFPVLALALGGLRADRSGEAALAAGLGAALGYGCTLGALWATNGRSFAWWEYPLATFLVLVGSAVVYAGLAALGFQRSQRQDAVRHAGEAR